MQILYHFTDLHTAFSIRKQGVFFHSQINDNGADSGINCFAILNENWLSMANKSGVMLTFHWHGKTLSNSYRAGYLVEDNQFAEGHTRYIVMGGNNPEELVLVDISITPQAQQKYIDEYSNHKSADGVIKKIFAAIKGKTDYAQQAKEEINSLIIAIKKGIKVKVRSHYQLYDD